MASVRKEHRYPVTVTWRGNTGAGTRDYRAYSRQHDITAPGKPVLAGSSDPAFLGDATRYNPEELLVASLSACHMLWYLHLCADAGISVLTYVDEATGTLAQAPGGGGRFTEVVLRPEVEIAAPGDPGTAGALHGRAHELCFIAASVSFPVRCEPGIRVVEPPPSGGSGVCRG